MDHVAIMNKKWNLIPKILSGEKYIESRWYQHKVAPWNKVQENDVIYFKNAGGPVIAKAIVAKVLQFEDLDINVVAEIVKNYDGGIQLVNKDYKNWFKKQKYCILIFLNNPQKIDAFKINKAGFGSAVAWLCVDNIRKLKMNNEKI